MSSRAGRPWHHDRVAPFLSLAVLGETVPQPSGTSVKAEASPLASSYNYRQLYFTTPRPRLRFITSLSAKASLLKQLLTIVSATMRYLVEFLYLSLILFLCCLTTFINQATAEPSIGSRQPPSLPFRMPQLPQQSFDNKRLWTRLRDGIIQTVWGPPPPSKAKSTRPCTSSTSPPSTLLARYGGDVVLRFKIQTAEEAQALAEATHVLFLDVWEFNNEWVDIRLSKDVVRFHPNLHSYPLWHTHHCSYRYRRC